MASVIDLAHLANMTYDSLDNRYKSYYRSRKYGDPGRGFYAELYFSREKNEAVLAIRGTDFPDMDDLASDVEIFLGAMPRQFKDAEISYTGAKSFANDSFGEGGYVFILTGHSLGGGLATVLSAKNGGVPLVTFNAPGMLRSLTEGAQGPFGWIDMSKIKTENMIHYRAVLDPVSIGTGAQLGRVYTVNVPAHIDVSIKEALVPIYNITSVSGKLLMANHKMMNMLKTVEVRHSCRETISFR